MSRIINRLAEATGGWEAFLYKTLKGVCESVGDIERGSSESIEEAREILEAYESLAGGQPDGEKIKALGDDQNIKEETSELRVSSVMKTVETKILAGDVEPAEDVEWELEDLILIPASRPPATSRTLTAKVQVDKNIGGSSGELPLPADHKLVNKGAISITTLSRMVLGTASVTNGEEGQVKGQQVSGHVSLSGNYRLAFEDVSLGDALINYEVVALPTKLTSKQYIEAVALANDLPVKEFQERLKHFGMVCQTCLCGKAECFGWNIVDQAVLKEAEIQREARMRAQFSMGAVPGAVPGPVA